MVKVFPDQDIWVDTQQMQVSSDEHDLMVVQRADGQTTDMWHRYFKVPDYGQAGLMLSDIMPAYSIEQTENGVPRARMKSSAEVSLYRLRHGTYTQLNGRSIYISKSMAWL